MCWAIRPARHHDQFTLDDAAPDPRQPVAHFEDLADQPLAGVDGHAHRGGELDDRELRHARRSGTGEREAGVPTAFDHGRGLLLGDFVGGAELQDPFEHPHLGRVAGLLFGAHGIEEGDLRVALELEYRCCCHGPH